ncbi:2-phospho-L-lactate transferase [Humibacter sp. RRB41]|uniref:2-phospho-L-lactate transferase n=1 Tax=Humibacter sp. RRB41 TaxID=2919946 RepID=UPI001FAAB68D|nr:2-phospho-L-lactate transferase [Humibacter sp. RRB41]
MTQLHRVTVLAGGVGGARFTRGLLALLADAHPGADVTVVVNTGDDMWLNGLRVCPDLDTVMYTLGGGINEEQGWGRPDETRRTSAEIAAYGKGWDWFTLGDLDLATHIVRTELLRNGATLGEATEFLSGRWQPGARLLPMSDQPVETHVRLRDAADEHEAGSLIHFEEWWVRYRAGVPATEFVQVGLESASAAPGVLEAIGDADLVVIPPSNPVVSIGTILNVPGIGDAVRETSARVVGISPIIGGAAVRGMADACLTVIGVETGAAAVGLHYGARSGGGLLDGWLVAEEDADAVSQLTDAGLVARAVPLWMRDVPATAAMAEAAISLVSPPSR